MDTRFDAVLYTDDPDFGDKLVKAIGAKPGETINIATPQFKRTDGLTVTWYPITADEYLALKNLDSDSLKKLGCQIWDVADGKTTWLYPHEWYNHIPENLEIVDICGRVKVFKHGETDNDMRFGALSFGFVQ